MSDRRHLVAKAAILVGAALFAPACTTGTMAPMEPQQSVTASPRVAWPDVSSPLTGDDGARDAAVIVAIERYAFLPAVPGAIDNGRDWVLYLTRSRKIPIERVRFLADGEATDFSIVRALENAGAQAEAGGRVWFVFIGHGAPSSATEDALLVAADAQQTVEGLENRSVARARALALLAKSSATPVAVIDACFSGRQHDGSTLIAGLQPTRVVKTEVPASAVVLSAAASNEYAGPLPGASRPAFSYLALGALRGWGDANADGAVTAQEVVDYSRGVLSTLLSGARTQTPVADGQRSLPVAFAQEAGPDIAAILIELKPAAAPSASGPSAPQPAAALCKCQPGDLLCAMRCSKKAKREEEPTSVEQVSPY